MRRWKISTTMMIGMVTSTAAAATFAIGCWNCDSPVKNASDADCRHSNQRDCDHAVLLTAFT